MGQKKYHDFLILLFFTVISGAMNLEENLLKNKLLHVFYIIINYGSIINKPYYIFVLVTDVRILVVCNTGSYPGDK